MIRVLFVCLGNICRSPMAEAVFMHLVREAGLEDKIEADSAGTGDWHAGQAAHRLTLQVLRLNGIAYSGRARVLDPADLDNFDYIVTMDDENLRNVHRLGTGRANVALLLDYAPHEGTREVPDPYYSGGFAEVYKLVHEGARGLLQAMRQEHGL